MDYHSPLKYVAARIVFSPVILPRILHFKDPIVAFAPLKKVVRVIETKHAPRVKPCIFNTY